MHVIHCRNVNDAYALGLEHITTWGVRSASRAGEVVTLPQPLAVVYAQPTERVLFDPIRDANPFFHLFESLWLLAGRNDAKWLDQFVHDFSSRFAEADGKLHGSYGFRWRNHFDLEGGGLLHFPDQLNIIVELLRKDPLDRRAVLQMWDPAADLGAIKKDVPCNLTVVPRVIGGKLHTTVFNRSNDAVWGMFGANAVQFSFLQEYLAGRIGVDTGSYTQITTNAHVYTSVVAKLGRPAPWRAYPATAAIGNDWNSWDTDLERFFDWTNSPAPYPKGDAFKNDWFAHTAVPLYIAHRQWQAGQRQMAYERLCAGDLGLRVAPDWRRAAYAWMERRLERAKNKMEQI